MGWLSDMKESAEAKFKEKAEAYVKDVVLHTVKSHLTLGNLPKLKRVLLLAADQELAEASWIRFETVVSKLSNPSFNLIGRQNFTTEVAQRVSDVIYLTTGATCDQNQILLESRNNLGHEDLKACTEFSLPLMIWNNKDVTGSIQELINHQERYLTTFNLLIPNTLLEEDGYRYDGQYYLSRMTPILVLYFVLTLLGDHRRISKLNPLIDLLNEGIIPYAQDPSSAQLERWRVIVD